MKFPCEIQTLAPRPILSVRFRSPVNNLSAHFGRIYQAIAEYLGAQGVGPAGPPFAIYHNMDMDDMDVEAGFPVTKPVRGQGEIQPGEIPGGAFAICHYTGAYDQIGPAYDTLTRFAGKQGFMPMGDAYEWYLTEPTVAPADLKTDIAFPVRRVHAPEPM
ncbi:MAG: GyrI-like domain-containing protein [Chloroflexi bacterium]|nr:GyrI-like domain-containing protein [Chloroflexota bacterium]